MNQFVEQLKLLTGQKPQWPTPRYVPSRASIIFARGGLGYNQLNEFLLALGYDRVTPGFFHYFMCPEGKRNEVNDPNKDSSCRIESLKQFKDAVERFRKLAMLKYGNFKFAFKQLSTMDCASINDELKKYRQISEEDYSKRPVALVDPEPIKREDTYLLGYISGKDAASLKRKKKQIVRKGLLNYRKALTDDYMDVYVATSMRKQEHFYAVYDFVQEVFNHPSVKDLKLRYFDPTQADPQDRIAKGLLEGLMVKRAKCTIYCAQESDTFGKDSELAATLAQGKQVIAYVPKIDNLTKYRDYLKKMLQECAKDDPAGYLKGILTECHPRCINKNPELIAKDMPVEKLIPELSIMNQRLYDERAETLHKIHPLTLQINLQIGVANGVLVARSPDECARLLRGIMLKELEFDIEESPVQGQNYNNYVLRERSTKSVFRVVTGDLLLTNSFWNFYMPKVESE